MTLKDDQSPARMLGSLGERLRRAVGHRDYTRFIVLSRSRTGSNMLISFLNSHPDILVEGEIFAKLNGRDHRDILAGAYGKQPHRVKAKGFKIFYYHPQDGDPDSLFADLTGQTDLRVIHLKRRNILRTLISRKIAAAQDVWAVTTSTPTEIARRKAVRLSVEELEDGFRQTRAWEERGDAAFSGHRTVSIYYEDLVASPKASFETILGFLDLPYRPLETNHRRQNPEHLEDLVTNYGELKAAFAGTPWQDFFED